MAINILHLETATKVCSVGLSSDGNLKALCEVKDDGYVHGEQLTLLIEEALSKAALKPADLSAVSVTSGPGSYTGLRIGVSTAKGLCYALDIPLIAIDTLRVLAHVGRQKHTTQTLCPLIDARRMEVYNAIYDSELKLLKAISADILEETSYASFEPFVCFGDGAPKVKELWQGRNIRIDTELENSASGHVSEAFDKYNAGDFEDLAYFEPFYLKDFVVAKKGEKTGEKG